jgi:hypothetical protein
MYADTVSELLSAVIPGYDELPSNENGDEAAFVARYDLHLGEVVRPARYGWVRRRSFDKMFDEFAVMRRRSVSIQAHLDIEARSFARNVRRMRSTWTPGRCDRLIVVSISVASSSAN